MEKKNKTIIAVVFIVVLIIGLVAGMILVRRNQDIRRKAAPSTTLSITPSTQSKLPGNTVNFVVEMATGTNLVTGIDVRLSFDPSVLTITDMSLGASLANFQEQSSLTVIDNDGGSTAFVANTLNPADALSGESISVINVTGVVPDTAQAGSYLVSFAPKTAVAGRDGTDVVDVLSNTVQGTLSVGISELPTPTPTPETGSLTPTPTPTPTTTGGSSGTTPTPTPTPTTTDGTGGGSATATPTPTAAALAPDDLPETGVGAPFILGSAMGIILLLGSIALFAL